MDAGGGDPTASVSAAAATLDLNSAADVEEELVNELKDQGIFDKLRKECLNDVDTKVGLLEFRTRGLGLGWYAEILPLPSSKRCVRIRR